MPEAVDSVAEQLLGGRVDRLVLQRIDDVLELRPVEIVPAGTRLRRKRDRAYDLEPVIWRPDLHNVRGAGQQIGDEIDAVVGHRGRRRAAILADCLCPDVAILGLPDDHGRRCALVAAAPDRKQRDLDAAEVDDLLEIDDIVARQLLAVEGEHLVGVLGLDDRQLAAFERDRLLRRVLREGDRRGGQQRRRAEDADNRRLHRKLHPTRRSAGRGYCHVRTGSVSRPRRAS